MGKNEKPKCGKAGFSHARHRPVFVAVPAAVLPRLDPRLVHVQRFPSAQSEPHEETTSPSTLSPFSRSCSSTLAGEESVQNGLQEFEDDCIGENIQRGQLRETERRDRTSTADDENEAQGEPLWQGRLLFQGVLLLVELVDLSDL